MILLFILFFAGFSAVTMWLWNWLMPGLFDLPVITFWQAAGILLLSKIIFGFGRGGGKHHSGGSWKAHWARKWQHLPEEQREKWRQKFEEKWSCTVRKPEEKPVQERKEQQL